MPTTDEPERRFAAGAQVLLDGRVRTILESRLGRPLALLLDGVTDREGAEALRGSWLYVDVAAESAQEDDEFYDHELEGLEVRLAGETVGTVSAVLHLPSQDLLEVQLRDGGTALVPFVTDLVPVIDTVAGFLEVADVEGILGDED